MVDVLLTSDRRTRNLFRRGRFGVSSRVHGVATYTPMTAYPAPLGDNLSGNSGRYGAYNHPLTSTFEMPGPADSHSSSLHTCFTRETNNADSFNLQKKTMNEITVFT